MLPLVVNLLCIGGPQKEDRRNKKPNSSERSENCRYKDLTHDRSKTTHLQHTVVSKLY